MNRLSHAIQYGCMWAILIVAVTWALIVEVVASLRRAYRRWRDSR